MNEINFSLLEHLATKPHPLLNICDDFEQQIRETPISWTGEVFQEARNAHHLLDMAGIPRGEGYASDLDARTWLLLDEVIGLRDRLDRIASWHSRWKGEGGLVDDTCVECSYPWPCDTHQMATGTYSDDATPLGAVSPGADQPPTPTGG